MKDIDIAVELLKKNNFTLVVVKEGKVIFSSYDKGINPLYTVLREQKEDLKGASIADRVTGKAAAMLCSYAEIKELKTELISVNAINVLKEANIKYDYVQITPYIKNRDQTGMCPVETLTLKANNIEELLIEIEKFLENIKRKRAVS
ncbi:MAG TPA: DUF1893 domain-containing protein [Tissierellia bacterium]|nr:DUF1893 domain-containing protein [Tissierellia bacterium]